MTTRATGTFDVKMTPQTPAAGEEPSLGRLWIDKQFHGDLTGTSQGQMLSARTAVDDSAGYVALERVTGTLHGRSGSFVLQHNGLMTRGVPSLTIMVVPDSGTGELAGLAGTMSLIIDGEQHAYDLDYTLPPAA
jgi:hypothetical protein